MIGFPELERYAILKQREDSVFLWLHSLDEPEPGVPVVLPWVFYWDYEVKLSDEDMAAINVERADQISIYCVVNVTENVREATINLFSPIVVNNAERLGRQVHQPGRGLLDPRQAVPDRRRPDARLDARGRVPERDRPGLRTR